MADHCGKAPTCERLRVAIFSGTMRGTAGSCLRLSLPMLNRADVFDPVWVDARWSSDEVRERLAQTDVAVIQRDFLCKATLGMVEMVFASGLPVVFEIDDLMVQVHEGHPVPQRYEASAPAIAACMRAACAMTVSTPTLGRFLSGYNSDIYVLPNLIDESLWPETSPGGDRVVIGYAATAGHEEDLALVEDALLAIAAKYGDRVCFKFYGCVTERLKALPNLEFIQFESDYAGYADEMSRCGFDIAIAPLQATMFNRAKSNIKWLEYSAISAAGVYSDLEPYNGTVEHGVTGMLAGDTPSWIDFLSKLIEDRQCRVDMAARARACAVEKFSLESTGHVFGEAYREILQRAGRGELAGKKFEKPEMLKDLSWEEPCRAFVKKVLGAGVEEAVLYGAGEVGTHLIEAASQEGLKIRCVVDRNPDLWGRWLKGAPITSLEKAAAEGLHVYVVASFAFADEIRGDIEDFYAKIGERADIFCEHGGETAS